MLSFMEKILISACLIGDNTKYDGTNNLKQELLELLNYYEFVPFCPEMEGGLKTPRRPSEIRADRVRNDKGEDVTKQFNLGADKAVSLCQYLGIRIAILKERSPSCGTHEVYNGLFNGIIVKGKMGITAQRLQMAGVQVMNEDEALEFLKKTREKAELATAKKEELKAKREAIERGEIPEEPRQKKPYVHHANQSAPESSERPQRRFNREGAKRHPLRKEGLGERTEKRPFLKDAQGETRRFGNQGSGPKKPFKRGPMKEFKGKPFPKKGDKK